MKEKWYSLKGLVECGDYYEISTLGRIKSIERAVTQSDGKTRIYKEQIRIPTKDKDGYLRIGLYLKGVSKFYYVHRLVALAFIPNPTNLPQVNHKIPEEKDNNCVDNLEWCDSKYNNNYSDRNVKSSVSLGRIICQIDVNTNKVIAEYRSANEASKQTKIQVSLITAVARKEPSRNTAGGFIWRWKDEM